MDKRKQTKPVNWGCSAIIIEQRTQALQFAYVVDIGISADRTLLIVDEDSQELLIVDKSTGEVIDRYDDCKIRQQRQYEKNSRRISAQLNRKAVLDRWRDAASLRSLEDVRSEKDLTSLCGDFDHYRKKVTPQGVDLLHSIDCQLSKKAKNLASMLILNGLTLMNYAIVTNDDLQRFIGDQSGNYSRHLKELEDINFCRVRNISKRLKLVIINPVYGYRGLLDDNDCIKVSALRKYYNRSELASVVRKVYEDGALEAA